MAIGLTVLKLMVGSNSESVFAFAAGLPIVFGVVLVAAVAALLFSRRGWSLTVVIGVATPLVGLFGVLIQQSIAEASNDTKRLSKAKAAAEQYYAAGFPMLAGLEPVDFNNIVERESLSLQCSRPFDQVVAELRAATIGWHEARSRNQIWFVTQDAKGRILHVEADPFYEVTSVGYSMPENRRWLVECGQSFGYLLVEARAEDTKTLLHKEHRVNLRTAFERVSGYAFENNYDVLAFQPSEGTVLLDFRKGGERLHGICTLRRDWGMWKVISLKFTDTRPEVPYIP